MEQIKNLERENSEVKNRLQTLEQTEIQMLENLKQTQ